MIQKWVDNCTGILIFCTPDKAIVYLAQVRESWLQIVVISQEIQEMRLQTDLMIS